MGTTPLGNVLMGYLAEQGGAPLGFAMGCSVTAAAALAAWARCYDLPSGRNAG